MDSGGRIYKPEEVNELEKKEQAGDAKATQILDRLIAIDEAEAQQLVGMNRAQRRAFYSNNRRKRPRFGGGSRSAPKEQP